MIDRLKEVFTLAECTATELEIDQIAFLIGSFPANHWLRQHVTDCPRIQALLPEMEPLSSESRALLQLTSYVDREDIVGTVADHIRRTVRS